MGVRLDSCSWPASLVKLIVATFTWTACVVSVTLRRWRLYSLNLSIVDCVGCLTCYDMEKSRRRGGPWGKNHQALWGGAVSRSSPRQFVRYFAPGKAAR